MPACQLRVLDDKGEGRSSDMFVPLNIFGKNSTIDPKLMRVHGIDLSIGYEFDAEMFACGQSPLCSGSKSPRPLRGGRRHGSGQYRVQSPQRQPSVTKVGLSNTINDPGNAEMPLRWVRPIASRRTPTEFPIFLKDPRVMAD